MNNFIVKFRLANGELVITNTSTIAVVPRIGEKIRIGNVCLTVKDVIWEYSNGNVVLIDVIVEK